MDALELVARYAYINTLLVDLDAPAAAIHAWSAPGDIDPSAGPLWLISSRRP
jgi:hypothetical protein